MYHLQPGRISKEHLLPNRLPKNRVVQSLGHGFICQAAQYYLNSYNAAASVQPLPYPMGFLAARDLIGVRGSATVEPLRPVAARGVTHFFSAQGSMS